MGGNLPLLASLLPEAEDLLGPLVLEILSPQAGDGADRDPGQGQGAGHCPIAQAHGMESVDRAEQVPCLLDGKAWSLAVRGVVLVAADRLEGTQGHGAADDQGVEEVPLGARAWFLVALAPGNSSMMQTARTGETWESSRAYCSHEAKKRLTTRP